MEKQGGKNNLLQSLLEGDIKTQITADQQIVKGIPEAICSGGYPEPNTRPASRARQWYRQYLNAIIQRDVKDVATIRGNRSNQAILPNLLHI